MNKKRRKALVVHVGSLPLGGKYPIRIQSMIKVSTLETNRVIQQCIRVIEAGVEYIRLSVRGIQEVKNLKKIKEILAFLGYNTPLIADVHFHYMLAIEAAKIVDKVRINPGNFVNLNHIPSIGESDLIELKTIRKRFVPFLKVCKKYNTSIRIGVNHGSLSSHILNKYGNNTKGMIFSCMEFLRVCIEEQFLQVVVSIKSSNVELMVRTVRLMVEQMKEEKMHFPIHLGVTEVGDGGEGRVKSAVGIGTLLLEGIGDTIRISVSEDPEMEIPIAKALLDYVILKKQFFNTKYSVPIFKLKKIQCKSYVIADRSFIHSSFAFDYDYCMPDFVYIGKKKNSNSLFYDMPVIIDFPFFSFQENTFPLFTVQEKKALLLCQSFYLFLLLSYEELDDEIISIIKQKPKTIIIVDSRQNNIYEQKVVIYNLIKAGINNPLILREKYNEHNLETLQIKASVDTSSFLLDYLVEGLMIGNCSKFISYKEIETCSFMILQSTGRKITQTEYIACPGCGRTLFNLRTTLKKIKEATKHIKGLKIAVMGCIVNGLGEMRNADFGYIGGGYGKIDLYKSGICIQKNIPEEKAVEELLILINIFIEGKDLFLKNKI